MIENCPECNGMRSSKIKEKMTCGKCCFGICIDSTYRQIRCNLDDHAGHADTACLIPEQRMKRLLEQLPEEMRQRQESDLCEQVRKELEAKE